VAHSAGRSDFAVFWGKTYDGTGHDQLGRDSGIIEKFGRSTRRIRSKFASKFGFRYRVDHIGVDLESELESLQRGYASSGHSGRQPDGVGPETFVAECLEAKDVSPQSRVARLLGQAWPLIGGTRPAGSAACGMYIAGYCDGRS